MSFIIYPKAKKIVTVSDMVYRYRVNFSGITQSSKGKLKMIDTLGITRLVMSEGCNRYINRQPSAEYFSSASEN